MIITQLNTILRGAAQAGFTEEYQAVLDAWTIKPDASVKNAQNTMVKTLVDNGIWSKLDLLYIYAGHTNDNGESLINWINPATFQATLYNSPAFVSLEGFTGNGTSAKIGHNWIPNTDGVNYQQDSASLFVYSRTNNTENVYDVSAWGAPYSLMRLRTTGDQTVMYLNQNGSTTTAGQTNSSGFYVSTRNDGVTLKVYRNSIEIDSEADASTGMSANELFSLGDSSHGTWSTKQLSCLGAGAGLSPAEVTILTNAIEAYMDSNGKGVFF